MRAMKRNGGNVSNGQLREIGKKGEEKNGWLSVTKRKAY